MSNKSNAWLLIQEGKLIEAYHLLQKKTVRTANESMLFAFLSWLIFDIQKAKNILDDEKVQALKKEELDEFAFNVVKGLIYEEDVVILPKFESPEFPHLFWKSISLCLRGIVTKDEKLLEQAKSMFYSDHQINPLFKETFEDLVESLKGSVALSTDQLRRAEQAFLKIINQSKDPLIQIRALLTLRNIHRKSNRVKDSIPFLNDLCSICQRHDLNSLLAHTLHNLAYLYQQLGDLEKAKMSISQAIEIRGQLKEYDSLVNSMYLKGVILQNSGHLTEAMTIMKEAKELAESIHNMDFLGKITQLMGIISENMGDYTTAIRHFESALQIAKQLNKKKFQHMLLLNLAQIYHIKGQFKEAEEYYAKSLDLLPEEPKNQIQFYLTFSNFWIDKGEISKAQTYLLLANQLLGENVHPFYFIQINLLLGQMYQSFQNYNDANKVYDKALEKAEMLNNPALEAEILFYQLLMAIENHENQRATSILSKMQSVKNSNPTKIILQLVNLSEAIFFLSLKRIQNLAKAEVILRDLSDTRTGNFKIQVFAWIYLGELLLLDYQSSQVADIAKELESITKHLFELSKTQAVPKLSIDALFLLSKLQLAKGKFEEANKLLDDAAEIANRYHLDLALSRIEKEKMEIQANLERLMALIQSSNAMQRIFEETQIRNYLKQLSNTAINLRLA